MVLSPVKLGQLALIQLALVLALCGFASSASAKIDGIATTSCSGCHGSAPATVSLTGPSGTISPGDIVLLTVTIQGTNTKGGGFYISSGAEGTFIPIAGEGTKLNGSGIGHSARKAAVGGVVTFHVNWQAPATPGGTRFDVGAVSANADGTRGGDETGTDDIDLVYGCPPVTVYRDYDQDGYGTSLFTELDCGPSALWADQAGDCNENDALVNPGAAEVCNLKDDNCDTNIDEGLNNVTVYLDADGDGHGVPTQTALGCGANPGYASVSDDCDDTDPLTYPGATELCDQRDDNCDGNIDEGLIVSCGVGECARTTDSCFNTDCVPGVPTPEVCNGLDDNCNVYIDDGNGLCPVGQICVSAQCVDDPNYSPDAGMSSGGGQPSMMSADASMPASGGTTQSAGGTGGESMAEGGQNSIAGGASSMGGSVATSSGGDAGAAPGSMQANAGSNGGSTTPIPGGSGGGGGGGGGCGLGQRSSQGPLPTLGAILLLGLVMARRRSLVRAERGR
ncbi:MAG TPA: choice-of-anchor V domain-containing protein [Polyangiaceae bacterium]|nr:choice-of-anchor V domain-containing protein [Polyangiaceae bacterium]